MLDLSHFAFTVSELDRSEAWYRELLGFELVHRRTLQADYTREMVGMADAVLDMALMRFARPDGTVAFLLELIEYDQPVGKRVDPATNNPGTAHLAFVVADIEREYERLSGRGVVFVSPPVELKAGPSQGGRACYFKDPDGITLELMQLPDVGDERV